MFKPLIIFSFLIFLGHFVNALCFAAIHRILAPNKKYAKTLEEIHRMSNANAFALNMKAVAAAINTNETYPNLDTFSKAILEIKPERKKPVSVEKDPEEKVSTYKFSTNLFRKLFTAQNLLQRIIKCWVMLSVN